MIHAGWGDLVALGLLVWYLRRDLAERLDEDDPDWQEAIQEDVCTAQEERPPSVAAPVDQWHGALVQYLTERTKFYGEIADVALMRDWAKDDVLVGVSASWGYTKHRIPDYGLRVKHELAQWLGREFVRIGDEVDGAAFGARAQERSRLYREVVAVFEGS